MIDWHHLSKQASDAVGTPCYVLSEACIHESLKQLRALESSVRLRHWVSFKTQPVARLMSAVLDLGIGVDVVSGCELHGALCSGFSDHRILVNGIGKHSWLKNCRVSNLVVHFDSLSEVLELAQLAVALKWTVGLRCAIPAPEWNQFGMTPEEMQAAVAVLEKIGIEVRGLHFHLHTSTQRVDEYRQALKHVAEVAKSAGIEPAYLDVGGGLPIPGESLHNGTVAAETFSLATFRDFLGDIPLAIPSVEEVWLENGRFLTGVSGALVITVLDKKERGGETFLICNGGLVNHARMAAFEKHDILVEPSRKGAPTMTHVCGPTCGAVDRLGSWMLPQDIAPGDKIVWLNAGAYHIPLETRFSFGLAPVVWFNQRQELEVIRGRETPEEWWGMWTKSARPQSATLKRSALTARV
jgi:diaminopimelate decarboxylase